MVTTPYQIQQEEAQQTQGVSWRQSSQPLPLLDAPSIVLLSPGLCFIHSIVVCSSSAMATGNIDLSTCLDPHMIGRFPDVLAINCFSKLRRKYRAH